MTQRLQDELIRLRKLAGEPALQKVLDEVESLLTAESEIEAEALLQNVEARLYAAGSHAA